MFSFFNCLHLHLHLKKGLLYSPWAHSYFMIKGVCNKSKRISFCLSPFTIHQKRILHKSGYSGSAANCQPLNQEQRESTTFRFADFTSCEWFTESDKPSVILVQKEKVWLLCERVRTKISDDYFKIIILWRCQKKSLLEGLRTICG